MGNIIHKHRSRLTSKSKETPDGVAVAENEKLKSIRELVESNNKSELPINLIIAQIYMESRFDSNPVTPGSSAKGLLQLLRGAIRELYRIENNKRPRGVRKSDAEVFAEADAFHRSDALLDEATNIAKGTEYLQLLIDNERKKGAREPVEEAYKDYRGLRNGIYYRKIKSMADGLDRNPDSMQPLREGVR